MNKKLGMVIKRIFIIMLMMLGSSSLFAQDLIILRDGTEINSKVISVDISAVVYKKQSNLDGPNYTIGKDEIFMIKYQNGEKDVFADMKDKHAANNVGRETGLVPKEIKIMPAVDNASVIEKYNALVSFQGCKPGGVAKEVSFKFGVTKESVMSNDDLEISIEYVHPRWCCQYGIALRNKTGKIIYVDLGNSFKVETDGKYLAYYNGTEQTTVTHGSESGASIGLGSVADVLGIGGAVGTIANGVNVGGGSNRSTSTTYTDQRILAIPPHGKTFLTEHKSVVTKHAGVFSSAEFKDISHYEKFSLMNSSMKRGDISKGETKIYDESNTPCRLKYLITYSKEQHFSQYSTICFEMFVQQAYGGKRILEEVTDWEETFTLDKSIKKLKSKLPCYNPFVILGDQSLDK